MNAEQKEFDGFERKTIKRGTQKLLRARVRELKALGWEKDGAEFSVVEAGPGFRRAVHTQIVKRKL